MSFNPFIIQRLPFCDINITHSFIYSRMYVEDLSGSKPAPAERSTVLALLRIKICCFTTEAQRRQPKY